MKILLVEDDPASARLIREVLRFSSGAEIAHVERLSVAAESLAQGGFDAILLDLQLPDGCGLEAVQRMRDLAPELPIVVLTGTDDEQMALEAVQAGAQDYMVKGAGITSGLLVRTLRYAIERQRGEAALRRAYAETEKRVRERTIELSEANARLANEISERKRADEALREANQQLTNWVGELERRTREMTLLNEMGDLLQSCLSLPEAAKIVAQAASQLFPGTSGALFMNESRQVEAVSTWGTELNSQRVFSPDDCWALRRGRLHRMDPPSIHGEPSIGSLACGHVHGKDDRRYFCVPMIAQGEALGVFYLEDSAAPPLLDVAPFPALQPLALSLAEHVALALANLRLRETLRRQAIRDPLTGLFNRRYLEETLQREIRRAERNHRPLGAVLIDLDHFKRFNDRYGHQGGDALLRALGRFLQSHTRGEDIACRYGGEEFVLILPEAALPQVQERAEQLREAARHLAAEHGGAQLGGITLSLGIAVFPDHAGDGRHLLGAADEALYRAKAAGRDRVAVADPAVPRAAAL